MTLDDIKAMDREMLTPRIVAQVIGCAPYCISVQARTAPELLGFPVSVQGTRTRIPRRAFIRWMEGVQNDEQDPQRTPPDPAGAHARGSDYHLLPGGPVR